MYTLLPAIMEKTFEGIQKRVDKLYPDVKLFQIDIMDGKYVPSTTWPFSQKDSKKAIETDSPFPHWGDAHYELDLMVENASDNIYTYINLGPKRIIFHIDAEDDLLANFKKLDPVVTDFVEFSVAVGINTSVSKIKNILPYIVSVQCMGISEIGKQGEELNPLVFEQIQRVRKIAPDVEIAVDGGVNEKNINDLVSVGVTRIVAGSAIYNEGKPIQNYFDLAYES